MIKFFRDKQNTKWRPGNRSQKFVSLFFVLIFGGIGSYLLFHSFAAPPPKHVPWKNNDLTIITQDNEQLNALDRGLRFNPKAKDKVAAHLVPLAKERKSILLNLMATNQQLAASQLLPDYALDNLGKVGNKDIEKKVTVTGMFDAYHYHKDVPGGKEEEGYSYFITTEDGIKHPLYTNGLIPRIPVGSTIQVTGYQLDQTLFAEGSSGSDTASIQTVQVAPALQTLGQVKAAVILINYANSTTSLDPAIATNAFSGSPGNDVDSYFAESSYGLSSMSATVFGPYRSVQNTGNNNSCPIINQIEAMNLANADANFTQFPRIAIVYNCTYGGSASLGPAPQWTPDGTVSTAISTYGTSIYNGNISYVRYVFAHELSHNLGYHHASYFSCGSQSFLPLTRFDDNCQTNEYGDRFDMLGSSNPGVGQLNPFHKTGPGWLNSTQLVNVTSPGTYNFTLSPYETSSNAPMALNIPRGNSGTNLSVEYRQATGFDSFLSNLGVCKNCNINKGASIRLTNFYVSGDVLSGGGGSDTEFIDMSPSSQSGTQDGDDGALMPGKTFTDPEYGISIKTIAASASGLDVQVTIPSLATCSHNAPTVTLTSASTQSSSPTGSATYSYNVKNNDSSSCAAEKFKYFGGRVTTIRTPNDGQFHDFTGLGNPDVFTLAPGASTTMNVTLLPGPSEVAGTYNPLDGDIGSLRSNAQGVPDVAVPPVTYNITAPADSTAPTAPSNLSATVLGSSVAELNWTASNDAGSGVAGYYIVIDGAYIYYSASPTTRIYQLDAGSTHSFTVQAYDRLNNLSTISTGSFTMPTKTDTTVPTAPGNFRATVTDRTITLSWSPSTDDEGVAYYYIYGAPNGDPRVSGDTTSITFSNLPTNTSYTFIVQAGDGSGNETNYGYGNLVQNQGELIKVTTGFSGTTPPSQPTRLYDESDAAGKTNLVWDASTDDKGVAGYYVYRNGLRYATVTSNSFTDTPPQPAITWSYYVVAFDADGNISPRSQEILANASSGISDQIPPSLPIITLSSATDPLSGVVNLSATVSDNVAVSYLTWFIDDPGSSLSQISQSPYKVAWDTTQTYNGPHTIYAQARDGGNNSRTSILTVNVQNGTVTGLPAAPTNLTATAVSTSQINLAWTPSSGSVSGYDVYRDGTKLTSLNASSCTSSCSFGDTGLTASTTYSYYVKATNNVGASDPSNTVTAKTKKPAASGTIKGTIYSSRGGVLAGANVTVNFNNAAHTYTTDSNGFYLMVVPVKANPYTVKYSASRYLTQSLSLSPISGATINQDVTLVHK